MIIDFNNYKNKPKNETSNIKKEDLFTLFLIFKHQDLPGFINLCNLQESMAKYKNHEKFSWMYNNVVLETNSDREFVDFQEIYQEYCEKNIIIEDATNPSDFMILSDDLYFDELKSKYDSKVLEDFNDLMFYVNNDLKYGQDEWDLLFEDEYVTYPKYPGIVTGEFIGQPKEGVVLQRIKKKCIQRLKDKYK